MYERKTNFYNYLVDFNLSYGLKLLYGILRREDPKNFNIILIGAIILIIYFIYVYKYLYKFLENYFRDNRVIIFLSSY